MNTNLWITLGPEPHLGTCTRCQATLAKPRLPCKVSTLLRYMHRFIASHRQCIQESATRRTTDRPQPTHTP